MCGWSYHAAKASQQKQLCCLQFVVNEMKDKTDVSCTFKNSKVSTNQKYGNKNWSSKFRCSIFN